MANGLAPDVQTGSGVEIIVPEGVQLLDPPRRLQVIPAAPGDTLSSLAQRYRIPLEIVEMDNPVLAQRQLHDGDTVFIATLL